MKAVDANVVLRLLLNDDDAQERIAERIVAQGVILPLTVLLETTWVLETKFGRNGSRVVTALNRLLDFATIHIADRELVRWAVDRYAAGADIADVLHLVAAKDTDGFITFDTRLSRQAGVPPVAVEAAV